MVLCLACFDDLHFDWLMGSLKMKTKKSLTVKKSPVKKTTEGSKMTSIMNLGSFVLQLVQIGGLLYLIRWVLIRCSFCVGVCVEKTYSWLKIKARKVKPFGSTKTISIFSC